MALFGVVSGPTTCQEQRQVLITVVKIINCKSLITDIIDIVLNKSATRLTRYAAVINGV